MKSGTYLFFSQVTLHKSDKVIFKFRGKMLLQEKLWFILVTPICILVFVINFGTWLLPIKVVKYEIKHLLRHEYPEGGGLGEKRSQLWSLPTL